MTDQVWPFVYVDPYEGRMWKKRFLIWGQEKVSCPPAIEQKPSSSLSFFCYAHFSWDASTLLLGVGILCLMLSQRSGHKVPLALWPDLCAFVWCWVPLRQWEALLLLPSEHPAFVMRPAVLVFIHSFQPSWNKFLLSLYLFPRQIHFFLIPPTFRSAHCCIFQVFLWSFSHILCDRNT